MTGRTHQIRVHLEAIGHPVAGDPVYGTGTSRRGPRPAGGRRAARSPVPPRLAAPADVAERRPPDPRRGAAAARARATSSSSLRGAASDCRDRRAGGDGRARMRRRATTTDRAYSTSRRDPGRPDYVVDGAPGAMLMIISGPSGVGKDTIIDALRRHERETGRGRRPPLRRHLHDPGAARRRGRRGRLPLRRPATSSSGSTPSAASWRRTRSTATGTARRATRSATPSSPAAT